MALVLNALNKDVQVRVQGAWFTFKPKQIKEMDENKVFFLTSQRAHEGFVSVPEEMADLDFKNSPEGKQIIKDAEIRGVTARVTFLEQLKQNEIVSLQRDLDSKNLKYDARLEMSPQMVANLEELASYKKAAKAAESEKVSKIKDIEKLLEE